MVPKKGKRVIRINHPRSGAEDEVNEQEAGDIEDHEVPSAFSRAMDKAEEAERDVLRRMIDELKGKLDGLEEELSRERAKLQNVRRRSDEDIRDMRKYGAYDLAFDLLNVLDCFEMGLNCNIDAPPEALKPYLEGVEYTVQELHRVLKKNGVEVIPTDIPCDPDLHKVFECVEDNDREAGTIIEVKRKGYKMYDRVLRTALVVIAGSPSECPTDSG